MNRHPIANTTRRQLGAWACARVVDMRMPRQAKLLSFGGSSPGPGPGGVPS
jgi:hypothetical protein